MLPGLHLTSNGKDSQGARGADMEWQGVWWFVAEGVKWLFFGFCVLFAMKVMARFISKDIIKHIFGKGKTK